MPKQTVAIRLDPAVRVRLRRVAERRGTTPSGALRSAVKEWLDREERANALTPYDQVADLIGCVQGGDPGRSTRGAKWISETLRAKRRTGRAAR